MNKQDIQTEAFEIADLEYEIGGMGATERGDARASNDVIVIYYVTPN